MNRVKTVLILAAIGLVPFAWLVGGINGLTAAGVALTIGYLFVHVCTAGDPA